MPHCLKVALRLDDPLGSNQYAELLRTLKDAWDLEIR